MRQRFRPTYRVVRAETRAKFGLLSAEEQVRQAAENAAQREARIATETARVQADLARLEAEKPTMADAEPGARQRIGRLKEMFREQRKNLAAWRAARATTEGVS